jgi:hypothetical protein
LPFKTEGIEQLDSIVNVRVTSAEKENLKEEAHVVGMSVSALVRRRIFGRPVIANVDAAMIRELRRMGGLAKAIYLKDASVAGATASILEEISSYIAKLSKKNDDREKNK